MTNHLGWATRRVGKHQDETKLVRLERDAVVQGARRSVQLPLGSADKNNHSTVWRKPVVTAERLPILASAGVDELWIVNGRTYNMVTHVINADRLFVDTRHGIRWEKTMPIPDAEKSAGPNFEHADVAFAGFDEKRTHVADFLSMLVNEFPTTNILDFVIKD